MSNKLHITIDPAGTVLIRGQEVVFQVQDPPPLATFKWSIAPPDETFDSATTGPTNTWEPSLTAKEGPHTISAEVVGDKTTRTSLAVVVCAAAIVPPAEELRPGGRLERTYQLVNVPTDAELEFEWESSPDSVGAITFDRTKSRVAVLCLDPKVLGTLTGFVTVRAFMVKAATKGKAQGESRRPRVLIAELEDPIGVPESRARDVGVAMRRADRPPTPDQILWVLIRNSARAISFQNYQSFVDIVFCGDLSALCSSSVPRGQFLADAREQAKESALRLPFPGVDPYRLLKAATEVFVTSRCGVLRFDPPLRREEEKRRGVDLADFEGAYVDYLNSDDDPRRILPYLALVLARLGDVRLVKKVVDAAGDEYEICQGILEERLAYPCLIELIWSYWHEEGMLAQAMNALSHRFQNLRAPGASDPLGQLEIDPLRPLNNLIWGYVQDEQHRLSVLRRAHEYDHHYGMPLVGRAVTDLRTIDVRSKFLESFHNLLYQAIQFYRQDDDTTVVADGFPVLNALKETHYLLAQGAHNQFGDLPSTSRQEMLIEQWLLSRPEMREFLGGRVMVPYPEAWMDKVDAVKTLKGWTDTSVVHFHDLAVFGEQILLAVRYGGWSVVNDPEFAANWARYWRPEVQGYIHGYRAVTGVDLTADITDQQQLTARFMAPSVHLRNRLSRQTQGRYATQISAGRISGQLVARTTATEIIPASRRLTRGNA